MQLENVQNWPKNDQNWPKNVENQANWPKNIQKVRKLLQNSYSGQKPWDFPLKSYCWSPNLLGSSFPASDTISTSVQWDQCSPDNSASHYSDQNMMKLINLATWVVLDYPEEVPPLIFFFEISILCDKEKKLRELRQLPKGNWGI